MVLFVGKKRLTKCTATADQRVVVREVVQSVDDHLTALANRKDAATSPPPTSVVDMSIKKLNSADPSCTIVLQAEVGLVEAASTPVHPEPVSICSVDATTCLIVALRDPIAKRVVLSHFDHGGEQAEVGIKLMIEMLQRGSGSASGGAATASQTEVYMLGAVQFPKFSGDTLASVVVALSSSPIEFSIVPHGCCVWSQNLTADGKIRHRGLQVYAGDGSCCAVESDAERAYPEGRLRSLRCMGAEHLSSISLSADELRDRPAWLKSLREVEDLASRRLIVIRKFTWTRFMPDVARKPLDEFQRMSTTPDMEPDDFAVQLKASIVYGHIYRPDQVFPEDAIVFAMEKDAEGEGYSWKLVK